MAARYSALEPDGGVGGSPEWTPAELYLNTPSASSSGTKFDTGMQERRLEAHRIPHRRGLISLPLTLHVAVLALYVALCTIWILGVEQNIQVPLTSASRIQTWINLISHVVMLAFSTAIVALMQPIATRSPFGNLPQSLTALSDKISSWSGLGSSLLNLYHNLRFPATLGNAVTTTLYFSTLSGLGISSSFLVNVPAVNETVTRHMSTRIGAPLVSEFIPPGSNVSGPLRDFTDLTFDWYRSGVGVGMLNSDNTSVYPGLTANRIYDTLLPPMTTSSNSSAMVQYTDFNVHCGSIPQMSISAGTIDQRATPTDDLHTGVLSINYTLGSTQMTLYDGLWVSVTDHAASRLWRPADVLLRVPNSDVVPGLGRNLILYNIYNETGLASGSQPILDAEHSEGSPWSLQMVNSEFWWPTDPFNTTLKIQVIGCSLSTSTGQAPIDAATNRLLDPLDTLQGASAHSTWADWKPDLTNSNMLEDTWASMFIPKLGSIALWDSQPVPPTNLWSCFMFNQDSQKSDLPQSWNQTQLQDMYDNCHIPTVIEDYLTTRIFGPVTAHDNTTGDASRDSSVANATLSALESALADATAMTMWSAARASTLAVSTLSAELTRYVQDQNGLFVLPPSVTVAPVNGTATVIERVLVGRIAFNVPSLIVGTALAAILTALGVYILAIGDARRIDGAPINDAGLLSLMTVDNSVVAARLSSHDVPTVQSRRRAGDFLVRIVGGRLVVVEDSDKDLDGS
ncbi:unnamed protein product [Peniophora sp. CBMAI 1063]|nr:unnamed protein product [Peniophora sp. CBMAI 1063]